MYPNGQSIITLAEVKSLNNITVATYDTYINAVVPIIERAIETYCRRRFCKYQWIQWIPYSDELILDNWPINNVLLIGVPYESVLITDTSNAYSFSITQTCSNSIEVDSKLTITNTKALTAEEYLFETFPTIGDLKTAVEANVASVAFTYQTAQSPIDFANVASVTLRATMGKTLYAGVDYFNQSTSTSLGDVYRLSDNSDRLILNPNYCGFGGMLNYNGNLALGYSSQDILVIYDAGYTTARMPQDLKWVVTAMVRDLMSIYDVDGDGSYKGWLAGETLGDYTWKAGGNAYNQYGKGDTTGVSGLINKYTDQLDFYKKKCI